MVISFIIAECNGYCFNDHTFKYSINFPKGWKVEQIKAFNGIGAQASSEDGTQIVIGAAKQNMPNYEFSDEFAKYLANNLTYPFYSNICNETNLLSAYAADFNNNNAIVNTIKCDNEYVNTMYVFNKGVTYTLTLVYSKQDPKGYSAMMKSIKTFKITR